MIYLLDTNILIALSKGQPAAAVRPSAVAASEVLLSSVVVAEIEYGIAKSTRKAHNRRVFDLLLSGFGTAAFDHGAAQRYGPIRAQLEAQGRLIGPYGLMIAAHAQALGATLVIDNVREFSRVADLEIENWLAA